MIGEALRYKSLLILGHTGSTAIKALRTHCLFVEELYNNVWYSQSLTKGGSNEFQEFCNDVVLFDVEKRAWFRPEISGHHVPARYLHTATILDDKLYVYGGFAKNTECTLS